jgi:Zn-dependent protease
MDHNALVAGLIQYVCLIVLLTFHELAHAWAAWKCGDDTARSQGRISLNPLVHMDLVGTVVLPLLVVFLGATGSSLGRFIIGWGKPVPVNLSNLRHPRRDDTLIALAGPAMNLLLAFVIMGVAKVGLIVQHPPLVDISVHLIQLSLVLCFFNLLPIPPLDGSHVLKNVIGMSNELYWRFCQYGFIIVILALQFPQVTGLINAATVGSFNLLRRFYGITA